MWGYTFSFILGGYNVGTGVCYVNNEGGGV